MNEIAIRDEQPGTDLDRYAHDAGVAGRLAMSLAKTSYGKGIPPEEIAARILAGGELGMKPIASLKSFDVIQGQVAMRAHAQRAVVQAHGHEVELVESSPSRCVMRGRRKGSDAWQEVTWTIQRAAELGLTGKSEWKKQPQTMLEARATGNICRLVASDALHGMPYNVEELTDSDASPKAVRVSVGALLAAPEAVEAEPVVEDVDPVTGEIDPTLDPSWGDSQ